MRVGFTERHLKKNYTLTKSGVRELIWDINTYNECIFSMNVVCQTCMNMQYKYFQLWYYIFIGCAYVFFFIKAYDVELCVIKILPK